MVARVALHNTFQDRDKPIPGYAARLRGQAGICKFSVKCQRCSHEVSYTEQIIRDIITRNVADNDIQLELLGSENQNITGRGRPIHGSQRIWKKGLQLIFSQRKQLMQPGAARTGKRRRQ